MLSEECKEVIFPSLERFKTEYVDRIFSIKRMYSLENWYSTKEFTTYYIKYTEDFLATGTVNNENTLGDYITVEQNGNTSYININSFVGAQKINKTTTKNKITFTVEKMYMYMDYTVLTIKIKNQTGKTIMADTKETLNSTYLYDENGVRYTAFLNENAQEELKVRNNMENSINIKFSKMYNPNSRTIAGITLEDVVLNYDNYKNNSEEKDKIEIDLEL